MLYALINALINALHFYALRSLLKARVSRMASTILSETTSSRPAALASGTDAWHQAAVLPVLWWLITEEVQIGCQAIALCSPSPQELLEILAK